MPSNSVSAPSSSLVLSRRQVKPVGIAQEGIDGGMDNLPTQPATACARWSDLLFSPRTMLMRPQGGCINGRLFVVSLLGLSSLNMRFHTPKRAQREKRV